MNKRLISIRRHENGYDINLIEFLDSKRCHGIQIRVSSSNTVEIYGFDDGFPSPINMFQSSGRWHWATIKYGNALKIMKNNPSCEDLAYHLYTVVSMSKDPVLISFAEKFVKPYSMHGRVQCLDIEFT
ncbi:MAG: hypothetical protein QXD38_07070 [Ignisphaera sp.]